MIGKCITCGASIVAIRKTRKFCDTCRRERYKEYQKAYNKTEIAKELKATAHTRGKG